MKNALAVLFALTAIVGVGLVHGTWTERWRKTPGLEAAVQRLQNVPGDFGVWKAQPIEVSGDDLARAGAQGHRLQAFSSPTSEDTFSTVLLCGRSAVMCLHRPENCFPGAGFDLAGAPQRYTLRADDGQALGEFYTTRFVKKDVGGDRQLRIFWSWLAPDGWRAPENPRWSLASAPFLYKLYVIREVNRPVERLDDDPSVRFLRQFVPELTRALTSEDRDQKSEVRKQPGSSLTSDLCPLSSDAPPPDRESRCPR